MLALPAQGTSLTDVLQHHLVAAVRAPCGAPAFAVVLTWVAATQSAVAGFVYLFVFSLGMTAVLVGVGVFSGLATSLPRAGPWMAWIKRAAGVVLIGVAEYYLIQVGKAL